MLRGDAKVRFGRVVALGLGVWFRRFVAIHSVAAVCLAPLAVFPWARDPGRDGTIPGACGLYVASWAVAAAIPWGPDGFVETAIAGYLAQFAVFALVARDAHRRLSGREARNGLRALLGLPLFALGSLCAFALIDFAAAWGLGHARSEVAIFAGIFAVTAVQGAFASFFVLALPAAAVDGYGPFAALARSGRLGQGARFRVALPTVLPVALQVGVVLLVATLGRDSTWYFAVPAVLFLTVKACLLAALYREACLVREGPRPEEIGAIFA